MMLKHLFFALIILMLKSSAYASDEFDEEDFEAESPEVVDSFPRNNGIAPYPWQQWNFASYQPRRPIPQNDDDEEDLIPNADPRFVTDRCHQRHSYTTTNYLCTSSTIIWVTFTATVTETTTTTLPLVVPNSISEITSPTDDGFQTTPSLYAD